MRDVLAQGGGILLLIDDGSGLVTATLECGHVVTFLDGDLSRPVHCYQEGGALRHLDENARAAVPLVRDILARKESDE